MEYKNLIMSPLDLTTANWKTPNKAIEDIKETRLEIEHIAYKQFLVEVDRFNFTNVVSKRLRLIQNFGEPGLYKVIGEIKGNLPGQKGDTFTLGFIMKRG